jgi:hypothetical protein
MAGPAKPKKPKYPKQPSAREPISKWKTWQKQCQKIKSKYNREVRSWEALRNRIKALRSSKKKR